MPPSGARNSRLASAMLVPRYCAEGPPRSVVAPPRMNWSCPGTLHLLRPPAMRPAMTDWPPSGTYCTHSAKYFWKLKSPPSVGRANSSERVCLLPRVGLTRLSRPSRVPLRGRETVRPGVKLVGGVHGAGVVGEAGPRAQRNPRPRVDGPPQLDEAADLIQFEAGARRAADDLQLHRGGLEEGDVHGGALRVQERTAEGQDEAELGGLALRPLAEAPLGPQRERLRLALPVALRVFHLPEDAQRGAVADAQAELTGLRLLDLDLDAHGVGRRPGAGARLDVLKEARF